MLPTLHHTSTDADAAAAGKKMSGTISDEIVVKVPASEAWKLYGTLQLAKHVQEALPGLISKIDVVEGDGAAGTVLELFFPPGTPEKKNKQTLVFNFKKPAKLDRFQRLNR